MIPPFFSWNVVVYESGVDPLFALQLASTVVACRRSFGVCNSQPIIETAPEVTPLPSVPSQAPSSVDIQFVRAKWNATIRAVEEKNHSLPFILKISRPELVDGDTIFIRFQYAFHRDKVITDLKNRRLVEEALRETLQVPTLKIEGMIGEEQTTTEVRSQDVVSNVLKAFGGTVVE